MAIGAILNFPIRGFQFLFGIVILGLSVSLIRAHVVNSLPGTLGFAAFVAAITIVGALVGLGGSFISMLEGPVGLFIDAGVAIINLVGGILIVIKLNGAQCSDDVSDKNAKKLIGNDMLNGGLPGWADGPHIISHCKSAKADMVFMFLTTGLVLVAALVTFLRMRKGV